MHSSSAMPASSVWRSAMGVQRALVSLNPRTSLVNPQLLPCQWRLLEAWSAAVPNSVSSSSPAQHSQCRAVTVAATAAAADAPPIDPNSLRIIETELRTEAEQSYLSYAMSVIVGRALPDVRDGLKPVHRRILYAMHDLGMTSGKPYRKCARVVGEVLGKYHPHGDSAVYNALVRLAQDFSMQAPLIAGHGNFGSIDNDPAAAMRYTECRLQQLSSAMLLADLDTSIISFVPNFDESQEEPTVLPARLPNLLVNGSSGIAVGIATNIPPHNLQEVVNGLCALIRDPNITVRQLMKHIPAPDFPTGATILESDVITGVYHDGRGSITMRGKVTIEEDSSTGRKGSKKASTGKSLIVMTELPYQTNKADLVASIAELVDKGTITGVADVRDESDRDGMRIVVEVKRGSSAEVIVNNLYKHTALQSRFACNMVALVNGKPQSLNLKEFLTNFLEFRCDVVRKRAERDLQKAQARLHLVEGFLIAMNDLDQVVAVIRQSTDGAQASSQLQADFALSEQQAEGVLNLSLRRLTSLEAAKLQDEANTLNSRITDLQDLLGKQERVLQVVEAEAKELAKQFGRPRRSQLAAEATAAVDEAAFIPNDPSFIIFSKRGYIKRLHADSFSVQGRGGRGTKGATLKGDDSMEEVLHVMDHNEVLFFTQDGVARSIKAYQIPEATRTAAGTAITQVLPIKKTDSIAAMLPVSKFADDTFLVMLTQDGQIKRTPLSEFESIQSSGKIAIKLKKGDQLRWVGRCRNEDSVLIAASDGQVLHFPVANNLAPQGRTASGMAAMGVSDGAQLVGMTILPGHLFETPHPSGGPWILLATAKGMGKRVDATDFRLVSRNKKGTIGIKLKSGDRLVAAHLVGRDPASQNDEEVVFVSHGGLMSRNRLADIRACSRTAMGVAVLNLQDGDEVQTVTPIRPQKQNKASGK